MSKNRHKRRGSRSNKSRNPLHHESPQPRAPQDREIARQIVADPHLKIAYFIPHAAQRLTEASPFGLYTPAIHAAASILRLVSTMPSDVRELHANASDVLLFRLRRLLWRHVIPIEMNALQDVASTQFQCLFRVVLTNDTQIAKAVDHLQFRDGLPHLHVSATRSPKRLTFEKFNVKQLRRFVEKVLAQLEQVNEWKLYCQAVRNAIPEATSYRSKKLALGYSHHNVVTPNEIALISFGRRFSGDDPLVSKAAKAPPDVGRYVERICATADFVTSERQELMQAKGIPESLVDWQYILTVPSVYWGHYKNWRELSERLSEVRGPTLGAAIAYQSTARQETYFFKHEGLKDGEFKALLTDRGFRATYASRAADQGAYTANLCLLSAATLSPTLRLEPRINRVRGQLKMLANSVRTRSNDTTQIKQSRLLREIGTKLRADIHEAFLQRIDHCAKEQYIRGLKLVADVPLEWVPVSGLPLMLRFDVSRIPVLPGNLLVHHCIRQPIHLSARALLDVLVIRTFEQTDPLRLFLETAVKTLVESMKLDAVRVRFVDVRSVEELVEAVQKYEGAILIFDGHGGYEDKLGVGTIVVGGVPIEVWALREQCVFPPIVLFSACDTHPLDGSHGSSANAAFVLGAASVLATVLPINAGQAALFLARLVLRIVEFIPIALKHRTMLTWREVISGMLRMSYTSEVRQQLIKQRLVKLDEEANARVQLVANTAINERLGNWFELFLDALSQESGIDQNDLQRLISTRASMVDSIKYVQLGSPENIVIEPDVSRDSGASSENRRAG